VPAENGGYLNVNEGIVAAGLANVYSPGKGKKLQNWNKLIALQSQARRDGRGLWAAFEDYPVVKTTNGTAFHERSCKHLSKSQNLEEMKASEALDLGLHPCRTCLANK